MSDKLVSSIVLGMIWPIPASKPTDVTVLAVATIGSGAKYSKTSRPSCIWSKILLNQVVVAGLVWGSTYSSWNVWLGELLSDFDFCSVVCAGGVGITGA